MNVHSLTYNVQCTPSLEMSVNKENFYLIIKRGLNDQRASDVK